MYQARYATSIVAKYLDTDTVKASKPFYKTTLTADMIFTKEDTSTSGFDASTKFYKTTLPSDMIFTEDDTSTCDEQVEKLIREFNIHYISCIGSLNYLLSKILYLSFAVHKLAKFSENPGKVHF